MKRLLQVCFIAAMVFGLASCNKEENGSDNNGSAATTPTSLVGTEWTWDNGSIRFTTATDAIVSVNNYNPHKGEIPATYTYADGSGVLEMDIRGHNDSVEHYSIRFTVNGNKMTATGTPDGDVTLTRVSNSPTQPDTLASLVGTSWSYYDGEANITVTFVTTSDVRVLASTPAGPEEGYGTYSYSNGSGSMQLYMNDTTYYITFTVSGNTMTAYGTPAGTVTLTRAGSNPNPNPNPGGDVSNSLVGTGWMWTDYDDIVVVEFGDNGQVGIMVGDYGDDNQSTFMGTYTYSNGNGTISVYVEGQHYNITFTVNGNTLTAYNTPGGTITMTREHK